MPASVRHNALEGSSRVMQTQAAERLGTERERRALSSENGKRISQAEFDANHKHSVERGYAIEAPHHFADESMPAFLKAQEPPFYVIPNRGMFRLQPQLNEMIKHTFLTMTFPHPDKGDIRVIMPQRPPDKYTKLQIHEEYYPSSERVRFKDFSCGSSTRDDSVRSGSFSADGHELYDMAQYVERVYYDKTTGKIMGARTLNDPLMIGDKRDLVCYAFEQTLDGIPVRAWARKHNDVICCFHFNAAGAKTHVVYTNGQTAMYMGKPGEERMVSATKDPALHDGVVREFYAGPPGCAYLTRRLFEDNTISFFAGTTPDRARLVKIWLPSGKTELYTGEHKCERKIGEGFEPRRPEQYAVPSPELIKTVFAFTRQLTAGVPRTEAEEFLKSALLIAKRDGFDRSDDAFDCPTESMDTLREVQRISAGRYSNMTEAVAMQLIFFTGLSTEEALQACHAHATADCAAARAACSSRGLLSTVSSAASAVGNLLLGPSSSAAAAPAPAPEPTLGSKAGTQLRVGANHPRSDLHGKRLALTKPVGGDVWEFKWLNPPVPKLARGQTAWTIALAQTVTEEAYLADRAAKEAERAAKQAERAAKAASAKAKKDAERQARKLEAQAKQLRADARLAAMLQAEQLEAQGKQLKADACLAAELQAEEDKAAQPPPPPPLPPPGPPPKGKQPLKAVVRCPINGALLVDAVLGSDGFVYNKNSLLAYWSVHGKQVSPITRKTMKNVLMAHSPLRSLAKELEMAPAKGEAVPSEEPDLVQCPITHEVMTDPVLAEDGYVYDKAALAQWFSTGAKTSPLTGAPMGRQIVEDCHTAVLCRAWL